MNKRLGTTKYGGRTFLGAASAAWRWKSTSLSLCPTTCLWSSTKGPLTTLHIDNTFHMDRDQMRYTKGGKIGRLAIWHMTTHAALPREADKEMLVVLPEDITASPRSVPLGMLDSRKCKFTFGDKFVGSSMEDSVALPVFTPMNFWRCACKNEALV